MRIRGEVGVCGEKLRSGKSLTSDFRHGGGSLRSRRNCIWSNCASGDFVHDMGEKLMMEMVQKRRFLGY